MENVDENAPALNGRGVPAIATLPTSLKVDLKAIRAADTRAEEATLLARVVTDAGAGHRGSQIAGVAKKVAASAAYQTCIG